MSAFAQPVVAAEADGVQRTVLLPPSTTNPRNSEGDFIVLKDGRILFVYTHFTGGTSDHAAAHLASRRSSDGGKTWSDKDELVVQREGTFNVMSVSLLRLKNDEIALMYLVKNSEADCRPYVRFSSDEAKTWSDAIRCIDEKDYYVVNNDRLIQLSTGRLVTPASVHQTKDKRLGVGWAMCYLSDDNGRTWRRSKTVLDGDAFTAGFNVPPKVDSKGRTRVPAGFQEPGVVELKDGRLMMYIRTEKGFQYQSFSSDGGDTWSPAEPSALASPLSPATIERIPKTGDLLAVWNDHRNVDPALKGKRTPFNAAVSKDDGKTWGPSKVLESDPVGWYCYTAIEFVNDRVLLGHVAGKQNVPNGHLATTQITSFDVNWLYR